MFGNKLGNTPSERRPSAELVQAIRHRWAEVFEATDLEHSAELRVYPHLAITPKPVEVPSTPPVTVTNEVAGNVINLASQRDIRVLNEREQRMADARLDAMKAINAAEEASNEAAA